MQWNFFGLFCFYFVFFKQLLHCWTQTEERTKNIFDLAKTAASEMNKKKSYLYCLHFFFTSLLFVLFFRDNSLLTPFCLTIFFYSASFLFVQRKNCRMYALYNEIENQLTIILFIFVIETVLYTEKTKQFEFAITCIMNIVLAINNSSLFLSNM